MSQHPADHFSHQADVYARYRPTYPKSLFDYLATLCDEHELAWDCATGNGQAAVELAQRFQSVYATDISEQQLSHATPSPNVTYKLESVEDCSLSDASVDLVTAATAAHWFNASEYHRQVNRVLKSGGVLAVWSYAESEIDPEVDKVVMHFSRGFLKDYWPQSWQVNIVDHYKSLPFPYPLLETPAFKATAEYNLGEVMNYLRTWSSVQRYVEQHGTNPVDLIANELQVAWGDPQQRKTVSWPLFMKVGRKADYAKQ